MLLISSTALWATLGLQAAVAANPSAPPRLPDPRLAHRSVFTAPPLRTLDEPPQDWRQSQDLVRSLGGHAGHLRDTTPSPSAGDRKAQP